MNDKKTIAILFGGCSPEYSVSLQSAHAVISHVDTDAYKVILIGITKEGDWYLYEGALDNISSDTWHKDCCTPIAISPNRADAVILKLLKSHVEKIHIDAVLPILHGKNGEDGTVQGLFELAGIPVIGCGILSSALCMDKDRAHKLAHVADVSVPKSYVLTNESEISDASSFAESIGYPLFVKPVKAGSSFGITKVNSAAELPAAIHTAFSYDDSVIMEQNIVGIEVGCAIIGNHTLTVGEVDEIELSEGFFDYTEKYTLKTSAIHVPARVVENTAARIKETAKTIYQALGCRDFARVDMFLTESREIFFNEVNTIPGFTSHSRFPNMLKATGMTFSEIINAILEQAVRK